MSHPTSIRTSMAAAAGALMTLAAPYGAFAQTVTQTSVNHVDTRGRVSGDPTKVLVTPFVPNEFGVRYAVRAGSLVLLGECRGAFMLQPGQTVPSSVIGDRCIGPVMMPGENCDVETVTVPDSLANRLVVAYKLTCN